MSNKAYFITVEGIEGVGKTTAVQIIREILEEKKVPYVVTREPGGTQIAEAIRQLLLNTYPERMHADTELLLLFASRAQHIAEVIKPALASGKWVICDRFTDASYAYQGGGRQMNIQRIMTLEQWTHSNLQPDITLLLDAPVDIALKRIQKRIKDRIEQETHEFFERVRQTYLDRARQYPDRYRCVDASYSKDYAKLQLETILGQLEP